MLHINDLTYRLGDRLLFDSATVALPPQGRVGFVGRNGTGKTTLFRMILGELGSESGSVTLGRNMKIGAVAQEAPGGEDSLLDVVLQADTERDSLFKEAETAKDPNRIAEIQIRLADIDAHSAPARAASVLNGLGFDSEAQQRPCSSFSGGWRMRVALAAVLFVEPDLLLLDEPTNYLDLEGTLWLMDYLARYPHMALVISHDRDLLNQSVDHIMHLEQGKLSLYRGGYDQFERQRAEKQALQLKLKKKQEDERRHLQAFVDRFKAKASKASQAQSRVKRLEKLAPIATITDQDVLPFDMPSPERPLAPPIIAMEDVSTGYDETIILKKLNLVIADDDRIGLLGSNGNGKSTFAKLVAGKLSAMGGALRRSSKLKVGYFAQHQLDELSDIGTPYAHVASRMPDGSVARLRARCARMGFTGAKADTPITRLSGGEKARLMMGLAAFEGPHLLILDEPTNHLDIDSRLALMEAINDYNGAVILISHDRFLIESCADRLWLVNKGTVSTFDGDIDQYRQLLLEQPATLSSDKNKASPPSQPTAQKSKSDLVALRKKVSGAAAKMEKFQTLLDKIDAALSDPDAFIKETDKATQLAAQRRDVETALAAAENEWLEASEALEQAD
jgi:ATP-binding cassette subfamily F protein 3